METRTYFDRDFEAGEEFRAGGGNVCVYSARSPGKDSPNEDAAAIIGIDENSAVLVLADGMGGASAGQKASQLAVESILQAVETAVREGSLLRSAIISGFEQANAAVLALGVGAATTLAAVEIQRNEIRPYHVGDSEILVVGGQGKTKLQTLSHSPVAYAVEAGVLDVNEAMHHEERHFVSNAVGMTDMRIELGSSLQMARRDTLLLSSDGLTDNLLAQEIGETIRKGGLSGCVAKLVDVTKGRMREQVPGQPSKPDDLTIILFRPDAQQEKSSPAPSGG